MIDFQCIFTPFIKTQNFQGVFGFFLKALDIKGNICPSNVIHYRISFRQSKPLKQYLARFNRSIENIVYSKKKKL